MNSKFKNELSRLLKDDVISEEVANRIDNYYASKSENKEHKLLSIFGIIGSILVGLGIILVLAHNWDNFSKTIKTVFSFLPLIIGQIAVAYSLKKKKSSTWLESSGTFLFFAVGSSISLISQIYNIPGNVHTFLLSWILLCLPLVYLLKSHAVFTLSLLFATYYCWSLGYDYRGETPWYYLLMVVILLPFYIGEVKDNIQHNVTTIYNYLIPLSLIISFGTFLESSYQISTILYVLFFGLLYNIGKTKDFTKIGLRKNGYVILGSLGMLITMLTLSFKGFWSDNLLIDKMQNQDFIIATLLIVSTLILIFKNNSNNFFNWNKLFEYASVLIILIYFIGNSNYVVATILINALIFILGISTLKKGADQMNFGILNYGMIIISLLILCRFFDTDMTFIVRGLLFILVGLGFYISNYVMIKKMKKLK